MFDEYCDYCHKPIKKNDYLVHLRYPTFSGINEEYFHLQCYKKKEQQIRDYIIEALSKFKSD